MESIIKQLIELKEKLEKPFPYQDTDKIQEDFRAEFSELADEENCLTGDFNSYCMNIAGTLSYVLAGKTNNIPNWQIEMLQYSFFEFFTQYKFFENEVGIYRDFLAEYKANEEARKLLLLVMK